MHDVARPALPALPGGERTQHRLAHDRTIQFLILLGGLPATVTTLLLLWLGDYSPKVQWTLSVLAVGCWAGCAMAARQKVNFPLQTLTNLLAALREGDYSLRARDARRDDALGEVLREVNALGETLYTQRRVSIEAAALLRALMAEIDVAVFTFDDARRLRLVNRAGALLLARPSEELLGLAADEIGLGAHLAAENSSVLTAHFPGRAGTRWSLRRASFREQGRPHQLLTLADISQPMRDEERAALQRLIRVLGHELNNSLAPIRSIADSLVTLLGRPPEKRAEDWQEDLVSGLGVIAGRAEALGRFMTAYSQVARLPAPALKRQSLGPAVERAAALERRVEVAVEPGPEIATPFDADQIEQLLINLIRNAADASLEAGGGPVRVGWAEAPAAGAERMAEIRVEDSGLGVANPGNLFVPFFTTKPEGSGIGLVLCRQIAEAHGGSLTLENRQDARGCRACLRLPLG